MRIGSVIDDMPPVRRRKETIDVGVDCRKVELIHVLKMPGDAIQRVAGMSAVDRSRLRRQSIHLSQGRSESAEGRENTCRDVVDGEGRVDSRSSTVVDGRCDIRINILSYRSEEHT